MDSACPPCTKSLVQSPTPHTLGMVWLAFVILALRDGGRRVRSSVILSYIEFKVSLKKQDTLSQNNNQKYPNKQKKGKQTVAWYMSSILAARTLFFSFS